MVDEIYDRGYQTGRAEFHGGIDRLIRKIANSLSATFHAVERIQFGAPWKSGSAVER